MRDEYDFSNAKKAKPRKHLKVQKSFRLDPVVLDWLEQEGEKNGMGYQTFLNWYLLQQIDKQSSISERLDKLEKAVFKKGS